MRLPWNLRCLDHSLVTWGILCRRQVPARIRLGWRKTRLGGSTGGLAVEWDSGLPSSSASNEPAHAWIEVDGVPIHESATLLAGFTIFEEFDLGSSLGNSGVKKDH